MPKPQQQPQIGRFRARGQYQFGVLKRDTDPTSPNPEFVGKNRTFPGSYFLGVGCRTFSEFAAKNPLGLPEALHTCYQVNPDGTRSYFGEGTPLPRQLRPSYALSDGPPSPAPLAIQFQSEPPPIMPPPRPAADSEHIEFLRDHIRRLESRMAEKDGIINGLYQQLTDAREQAATLRKSLEGVQAVQGLRDQSHKNEMHVLTQLQKKQSGGALDGLLNALPTVLSIAERLMTKGGGGESATQPIPLATQPPTQPQPASPRPAVRYFPQRPSMPPPEGIAGAYSDFDDIQEQP